MRLAALSRIELPAFKGSYSGRSILILVAAFLLLRLALAATMPFTVDEAYAVVVSRSHSLSYFDHPPVGFALARLMADLTGSESSFVVRLPYVALGSLSALLLYDLSRKAYGTVPAFWATAWYSVAPFFFISASHFVVPDGPLDFFLLLSAWAVGPILIGDQRRFVGVRWTLSGVALAMALMSKYQAGLFCVSAIVLLLGTDRGRKELKHPWPWIAGLIASLGLLPVLIWNANHHWASFAFQSGRALDAGAHILHPANFAITLMGQALYVWPSTWALVMLTVWRGTGARASVADRFFSLLAATPIIFFDFIALITVHSLPHWSMSGFLFAFPMVGKWCAENLAWKSRAIRKGFTCSALAVTLLSMAFVLQARTGAFTRAFFAHASRFDVNWQSVGWSQLKGLERSIGLSTTGAFVVAPDWIQGGKIGVALGPGVPIEIFPGDPRHFQFMGDPRLSVRVEGFFIAVAEFGREDSRLRQYIERLKGRFEVTGPAIWLVQDLHGFPAFKIMVLPIRRA